MEIIILLAFGSFCLAIAFLVGALRKKKLIFQELSEWLESLSEVLEDFRHRKELLEEHTDDYVNSIGESGVRALYESQNLISRAEDMIKSIQDELNAGNILAVSAFNRFIADEDEDALPFAGSLVQYLDMQGWPIKLERNIQSIGGELAVASERFHQFGVERRKRRPTSMSLKEARIRIIRDAENSTESN